MENLSIGAVSRMTGLTEFTLRAWERRYAGIKPKRLPSGRRVYNLEDVEKLALLQKLTDQGHLISNIAHLQKSELAELVQRVQGSAADQESPTSGISVARANVEAMLQAVHDLDVFRLAALLKNSQMQFNTRSFLIDIVALFLREIGLQVGQGKLDVFHEHAASAVVRNFLTGILFSTEQVSRLKEGPPILFATPEGDHHEFGILIASLLCLMRSKKVFYLGANVPLGSLERAVRMTKSPLLVLGISAPDQALGKKELKHFMSQLTQRVSPGTEIWVGGERTQELKTPFQDKIQVFHGFQEFDRALLTV